jgi:opine dehydrogenase
MVNAGETLSREPSSRTFFRSQRPLESSQSFPLIIGYRCLPMSMRPDSRSPIFALIGYGLGGALLASELGIRGFRVRVVDRDPALIEPLTEAGGIQVEGRVSGFVPVEMATTSVDEAVEGASVIVVSTAATEHRAVATVLGPHLRDGQLLLLIQGHFGGALEMKAALGEAEGHEGIVIAEMDMFPFFGGKLSGTNVELDSPRGRVGISTMPSNAASDVVAQVKEAFPMAEPLPNVLHTGFGDLSTLVHSIPMVLNVNSVERDGSYRFYRDMMGPGVVRVIEECDRERLAIASTFGVSLQPMFEYYSTAHGIAAGSLLELLHIMGGGTFRFAPAPKTYNHRYITQDLGVSLVGWSEVGEIADVPHPAIRSIIELAGVLAGRDFRSEGRNAQRLGLQSARSADDVISVVSAS